MTDRPIGRHEILTGDATELPFDDESFHACVCDPPYGLAFMGKSWDDFEPKEYQEWCQDWAGEVLRALKPGGHMLAFSGSRTFHRLMCGIEDAGFEIRDTIMWMHGEGFPKGNDVGKDIDKRLGKQGEREVVDTEIETSGWKSIDKENKKQGFRPNRYYDDEPDVIKRTNPASEIAEKWDGWNTQLKPAFEPIAVARKPLEEDTVAEQVMATGTGALNIDSCRISLQEGETPSGSGKPPKEGEYAKHEWGNGGEGFETPDNGRHPANVVLDGEAAEMLDSPKNEGFSAQSTTKHGAYGDESILIDGVSHSGNQYSDSGGPSRFFYTSKARKSERTVDGKLDNPHPTVKSVDLMEWLVKLVTAEDQLVLDPFVGSGSTIVACENNNRRCIGVDKQRKWVELSEKRIMAERGLLESDPITNW